MIASFCLPYLLFISTLAVAYRKTQISEKQTPSRYLKPIAVKAETFFDLVKNSNVFVDKSRLIKAVLEDKSKVILITRPRYWGKSVNLDMIKTFVEMPVDSQGKKITPVSSTPNYRLFVNGEVSSTEKLKNPLLVAKEKYLLNDYLGKYPVIHLNLTNIEGTCYTDVINEVKIRVRNAYRKHRYMVKVFHNILSDEKAKESDKKLAQQRLNIISKILVNEKLLSDAELKESLNLLSYILRQHFGKDVFITIDEYDAPLNVPFINFDYPQNEREALFNLYTDFLAVTLKKNDHLKKGILTGQFPLTKEDIASGLHGITEYTFLNSSLMEYYGFEKNEVIEISKVLQTSAKITEEANSCFGGYGFRPEGLHIYNPHFIVDFLAGNRMKIWLDVESLINCLKSFVRTGVGYATTFDKAFQPCNDKLGGHSINVISLEGGHFTRDELEIYHKSLKLPPHVFLENDGVKAELSNYDKMHKFKIYLFLYTIGYFSMTAVNDNIIYLEYVLKDHKNREPILSMLKKEHKRQINVRQYGYDLSLMREMWRSGCR